MTDEHEHAMKVAKVIAKAMGDNFSDAFKNKQRWTAKRGMSGGRFRDVNEPFQDDYIAAAQAAAAAVYAPRIAELEEEVERLREALEVCVAELYAPDPACSCRIDPPCRDCIDYGAIREAIAVARAALAARGLKLVEVGDAD